MYAVIQTGGKQYRVQPGDIVQIEKIEGEVGTAVKFDQVLFCSKGNPDQAQVWIGKPLLQGASVDGEFVGQGRGEKLMLVKMKRRKQYRRTQGHRQYQTQILVVGVANGAGETATLSDSDKKTRLAKFQTHLAPKGPASTPKTLGSRKRAANAKAAAHKAGGSTKSETAAAPKASKAAAKKKTAK